MGWISSLFGSKSAEDPLQKLDPKLREFLEKESPVKLQPTKSTPDTDQRLPESAPVKTQQGPQSSVPPESLYKDGRYAELWKTYKPLEAVEADTKSSHEKLMDVLDGFKERKMLIAKAALENCAFQQEEWRKCMVEGSWVDTLQMCREQARRFERCYTMQSRFLRVLGYKAEPGRDALLEEDIQLHADTLYQRMIEHEEVAAKARQSGQPVPAFQIIPPRIISNTPAPSEAVTNVWKDQLEKLPEDERVAEEAALRADYLARLTTAEKVKALRDKDDAERRKRKEEGKATMGDHFWGFIQPRSDAEAQENDASRR
ncbi:hypothetical protein jhhlp_004476 [Lomentospora prolificans]|uniref:Autophagy-related protein 6 n=1 Tax=Lomentospora prolificans TaxID=41688 RepID=A0A2N3NBN6_9PEZI|nr:hypothetical protein jhhlp_004476 [Lomentospora prolificans]